MFVSYAQNFEDVMLWRALRHVEKGFYIDVGAAWPDEHSVTKAFYECGWHGINIEPNPEFNAQLCTRRRHDINLKLAVGELEGILTMNLVADTGLSTLDDAIAEKHEAAGWSAKRQEVRVTTLASVWHEHVPAGQDVHFLKVDVEGFEEAVLRGNDWHKYRPWVVIVEATLPMSQVESHEAWEPILLEARYQFAYADGLNRFYVAQEHAELLPAFMYPPNVFDEFKVIAHQEAEARAGQAEARAGQAEARAGQAEARAGQAEARAGQAEARALLHEARLDALTAELDSVRVELHEVHQANHHHWLLAEERGHLIQSLINSHSWRITAPLRRARGMARRLLPGALKSQLKTLLQYAALYVRRRPRLMRVALRALDCFPTLKARLFRVVRGGTAAYAIPAPNVVTESSHLGSRARQIYADLKAAIARHQKETR